MAEKNLKSINKPMKQKTTEQADVLQQKIAALEEQILRIGADYANYRRRTEEDQKRLVALTQARTLLELTPVLNNFKRATEHLPNELEGNNWVTGVLYVEKQLEQIMEQFGLQKIKTVGEQFDPKLHEAVQTEEKEGVPPNTVTAELEAGYILDGQILKAAKVKVTS